MTKQAVSRTPNTFENLLFGTTISRVPSLIPGVALAAAVVVAAVVLAVLAGSQLPGEFFPKADSGFIGVNFKTPPGTSDSQSWAGRPRTVS